jgi:hypothetical protein
MPSIYQLQKHEFDNVDDALQLLMECWQQIHTHLSKPSNPLDPHHGIHDEFADSLCALRKLFTDIQAEHSKDQKPVRGRWKQAKIAEDDISFSEDYQRGKGYRSNNSDNVPPSVARNPLSRDRTAFNCPNTFNFRAKCC